jgi:hypothetical protein
MFKNPNEAPLLVYTLAWLSFCAFALVLFARRVHVEWRAELRFIAVPWKIAVFAPAILFVSFAGRFTDDETWDVPNGLGMSLLTVLTAGWSIGTLAQVIRRLRTWPYAVVAIALWLFASSWYYDAYLLLRDGHYTRRWLGNLMISPAIYFCAGILMNLEARGRAIGLAFARPDWPRGGTRASSRWLAVAALPLLAVAAYLLVFAVGWHW